MVEIDEAYDHFVLTAGNDCNILLHRLSNGQRVGQFGQSTWDVKEISTMRGIKVNYVREWIQGRMVEWRKHALDRVAEAVGKGLLEKPFEVTNANLNDRELMKKVGFEEDPEKEQLDFNIDGFDSEIDYADVVNDDLEYEKEMQKIRGRPLYDSKAAQNIKAVTKKHYEEGYYNKVEHYTKPHMDKWKGLSSYYNSTAKVERIKERMNTEEQKSRMQSK